MDSNLHKMHLPATEKVFLVFFLLAYVSASIEIFGSSWRAKRGEGVAATALVYVKFGVQSSLKINTCVCA